MHLLLCVCALKCSLTPKLTQLNFFGVNRWGHLGHHCAASVCAWGLEITWLNFENRQSLILFTLAEETSQWVHSIFTSKGMEEFTQSQSAPLSVLSHQYAFPFLEIGKKSDCTKTVNQQGVGIGAMFLSCFLAVFHWSASPEFEYAHVTWN